MRRDWGALRECALFVVGFISEGIKATQCVGTLNALTSPYCYFKSNAVHV